MPAFGPISRADLIRGLRALGFASPFPGGRHAFIGPRRASCRHSESASGCDWVNLLARILRQAGVSREEWESA